MNRQRLDEILGRIARVRLAVVGDYFLDRYGRGRVLGVSRETGRRVLRLDAHAFSPGGTGNVAANAAALGARVSAVGVLGDDPYARIYRADLDRRGIDHAHLAADPARHTASFEKFLVERGGRPPYEVRLDVDNRAPVSAAVEPRLLDSMDRLSREIDALVVADYEEYGAGAITPAVLDRLTAVARAGRIPCLVMSRTRTADFAPMVPVQNEYEVTMQTGVSRPGLFEAVADEAVARAAAALWAGGAPAVFVTRGARGISIFRAAGSHTLVATGPVTGPVDTCGAGDTVLAAVAAALGAGAEPAEAALLANCAAHVTVQKVATTGTAAPDEIRRAFDAVAAAGGGARQPAQDGAARGE